MTENFGPLVNVEWLNTHFEDPNIVILDATIPKATGSLSQLSELKIPNTRRFDIRNEFSDQVAPYPNTMLSAVSFERLVQNLGINKDEFIVVYDQYGIYSSARAWWMFKSMGHANVAVLNGGLPAWKDRTYQMVSNFKKEWTIGNFKVDYNPCYFKTYEDIEQAINHKLTIIDARSSDRFNGLIDEPRPGLRNGHIPTSKNIPFDDLLVNGKMVGIDVLKTYFIDQYNPVFSCGSGVTACILALGYELVGGKNASVYDGSWTEWGSKLDLPIE